MVTTNSASPAVSHDAQSHEVKALAVVLREEFDTTFRFYDTATGDRVFATHQVDDGRAAPREERALALEFAAVSRPKVVILPEKCFLLGFPLQGIGPSSLVALGVIDALGRSRADLDVEQIRIAKWIGSVHERLRGAREMCDRRRSQAEHDRQSMTAWEAIIGLERLHRNLKTHKQPARNRGRILRVAGELLGVTSLAWVSALEDGDVVLEGEGLLSPWDCGQIVNHLADQNAGDESGYVLINEARESPWGARFPQVQNLLAVPVGEKTVSGWVSGTEQAARHRPRSERHRAPTGEISGARRIRFISGPAVPPLRRGAPHAICVSGRSPGAGRPTIPLHQGHPCRADALADCRHRRQG